MVYFTESELDAHEAMLAEKVFQVATKWPHFNQLLRDVRRLARESAEGTAIVSLERAELYGGISLVAPFFHRQHFVAVDCSPESANVRGAYNAGLVADSRCIRIPVSRRAPIDRTGLEEAQADLVLVPNLVHHVSDQRALFAEMARLLKPGGRVYVFEPILRELHQIPDDYLRYTPFGMRRMLIDAGLEPLDFELEGGPFSAIAYCWIQALQFFPAEKRAEMEQWFFTKHFPELMRWDREFTRNLVRGHTSFPVSFSIMARKPL